jgi:hypothetical protein
MEISPQAEGAETDGVTYLKDVTGSAETRASAASLEFPIISVVNSRMSRSEDNRLSHEERWLQAFRNFRGIYSSSTQYLETEKSRVFVKITKSKTLAAVHQINEVLFSTASFPLGVEPSLLPEGISATATIMKAPASNQENNQEEKPPISPYGFPGDGNDLKPGAILGPALQEALDKAGGSVEEGGSDDPEAMTIEPALLAAKKMEKTILDQLGESRARIHLKSVNIELCMLGTGVLKGPFTIKKIYNSWEPEEDEDGNTTMKYKPVEKVVPEVEARSLWNIYNDPDATTVENSEFLIDRHGFSRTKMRQLTKRPFFRANVIEEILDNHGPNYIPKWFETELSDSNVDQSPDRYEVLEYWGYMDKKMVRDLGIEGIPSYVIGSSVQVNVWVCAGRIIRMVLNPFTPARIPYQVVPYEINPYEFWGIGVPENMEDAQMIMNGHARMAIDNLALSGNLVFELDETNLVPGQDLRIHSGKIFRRKGGAPGQAIFSHKFNNTTSENMMMFDKFRQLADEATGIPSYSHGQTGVSGMTRTSSGMSMLMGASAQNIKGTISNIDDFLLRPLGESMFAWNMQFNPDKDIKGDLEIKARGTSALMLREVRSQRLMMFMQVAANPMLAPFVKWPTILREVAISLEIDPDKFTNTPEEAKLQALMLGRFTDVQTQGQQGVPQQDGGPGAPSAAPPGGGAEGPPGMGGGQKPSDSQGSGGAQIGSGVAPMPGEAGFTG